MSKSHFKADFKSGICEIKFVAERITHNSQSVDFSNIFPIVWHLFEHLSVQKMPTLSLTRTSQALVLYKDLSNE